MDIRESYTDFNSKTWNKWSEESDIWTVPISHEKFIEAHQGKLEIYLTPCKPVPQDWFPPLNGSNLLGLASGGGQQCPVFVAHRAKVTVFDYSEKQLEAEQIVADRERYDIKLVKGDMSKKLPFEDNGFDIIFHPVSNSYVQNVEHVWNECYRVLKPNGILIAGFSNPMVFLFKNMLTGEFGREVVTKLPVDPLKDNTEEELKRIAEADGIQFSHSLETQIGGQLKAGFNLTDLYEDFHNEGEPFAPTYIATRAVKVLR